MQVTITSDYGSRQSFLDGQFDDATAYVLSVQSDPSDIQICTIQLVGSESNDPLTIALKYLQPSSPTAGNEPVIMIGTGPYRSMKITTHMRDDEIWLCNMPSNIPRQTIDYNLLCLVSLLAAVT